MHFGAISDKGILREINEDNYLLTDTVSGVAALLVIADGMGGHNSGDIASKLAVDCVKRHFTAKTNAAISGGNIEILIKEAIEYANSRIYCQGQIGDDNFGMGTTLIVAAAVEGKLYVGHVGDSRLYIKRGDDIKQITTDHSYIEELVQNGTLTREQANHHPQKNIITRAVGNQDTIDIDFYVEELQKNDIILACTDGLTNMVDDERIAYAVSHSATPQEACDMLVDDANKNGGEDNITVVIFEV